MSTLDIKEGPINKLLIKRIGKDESKADDSKADDSKADDSKNPTLDITDIMEGPLSQMAIKDTNPKTRSPMTIFNSIFEKLNSLIRSIRTPLKSESPAISSQQPSVDSVLSVVMSGHSETTNETYEQNYLAKNAYFSSQIKNGYDNGILKVYRTLLNPDKLSFIMAVSQGICSVPDDITRVNDDFEKKYTRDAENMFIMYDKSVDLLRSIETGIYPNNRSSLDKYILDIKEPLNQLELTRYTNMIIQTYVTNIMDIIRFIDDYLLKALTDILSITPNDPAILITKKNVKTYKADFSHLLSELNTIKEENNPITKIADFQKIIQQTNYSIKWGNPSKNINVNKDIYNLVLLRKIISNVILTNVNITSNTNLIKNISEIDNIFTTFIHNLAEKDLPLFVMDSNDKLLFYEGVLQNSFWRSEDHLLSTFDTKIFLFPNPGESENDFDCSYGLNIFALMLNLNSPTRKSPKIFLPATKKLLRSDQQHKNNPSGDELYDTPIWRDHRLQQAELHILDEIVNIFKQNFFDDIAPTFKDNLLFKFIEYTLKDEINNIKTDIDKAKRIAWEERRDKEIRRVQIKASKIDVNVELDLEHDMANGIRIAQEMGLNPNLKLIRNEYTNMDMILEKTNENDDFFIKKGLDNIKYITQIKAIKETDQNNYPLKFVYCRVREFIDFLTRILVGDPDKPNRVESSKYKIILLSELIYLFQYLLKFEYVIYILPSCRICQPGQVPQQILRYGGNKSKRRNLKRKTYKKKTLKRKNLKRKTLKRKIKKRKTYKRKRLNN